MKLLHYSNRDGSIEYLVPVDVPSLTREVIEENARSGCELDGAFDLMAVSAKLDSNLREGAEYVRR